MSNLPSRKSTPPPVITCDTRFLGQAPATDTSSEQRRLPLGAKVSPLSPFFSERAKSCALEQVKSKTLQEALNNLSKSSENGHNRSRSTSQSSKMSEACSSICSSSSWTSSASTESNKSIATAISSMEDEQLPQGLPRIPYEDWSKFGISLFTPKLMNPHSQLSYHFPSPKSKRQKEVQTSGNRPRSKSSVVQGSVQHLPEARYAASAPHSTPCQSSPQFFVRNRPFVRSPLTRYNSLNLTMERNHTSY